MGGVQFIPSRLPSGEFALVMPNSGSTSEQWKPYYAMDSLSLRQNALDLNETLPRSAFSNVTKVAKHLDTSPLSPASSMSSNDDSSSNQIDLQSSIDASSPQQTPQKCLSVFPTPPSGGSITLIPTTALNQLQNSTITSATTLQQPHVTSTTEQSAISLQIKPISLEMSMQESDLENANDFPCVSKKQPHSSRSPENKSDTEDSLLNATKSEPKDSSSSFDESNDEDPTESCNGDMWRPW